MEDPARPSGRPGTRAPHLALGPDRSLLDLLDPAAFTLVRDRPADALPGVVVRVVGRDEVAPQHRDRWADVYAGHDVLVRPDGVIAARLPAPSDPAVLRRRLSAVAP